MIAPMLPIPGLPADPIRPALKWAGGKTFLVPRLSALYDLRRGARLVEPFCGALGVALGLGPKDALLNDVNPHLINFHRWVQAHGPVGHEFENDKVAYYECRDRFNALIASGTAATPEGAELFYYLNRTGFNGLCRFNLSGGFNVPFGKYKTINYRKDFAPWGDALQGWEFTCGDFEKLRLKSDDFVYADPPYDTEFTSYSSGGFSWEDQQRLVAWLVKHPGPVVASNQATDRVLDLYRDFKIEFVDAPRRISANGNRKTAREMLATRNL